MPKSPDAFRTISEVAEWLDTPAHVLRFWESKFSQVKPVKRAGGRRYYRPGDMALLGGIKKLLHDDGLTIKGVQKILREQGVKHVSSLCELAVDQDDDMGSVEAAGQDVPVRDAPFADVSQDHGDSTVVSFPGQDNASEPEPEITTIQAEEDEPEAEFVDEAQDASVVADGDVQPEVGAEPDRGADLENAEVSEDVSDAVFASLARADVGDAPETEEQPVVEHAQTNDLRAEPQTTDAPPAAEPEPDLSATLAEAAEVEPVEESPSDDPAEAVVFDAADDADSDDGETVTTQPDDNESRTEGAWADVEGESPGGDLSEGQAEEAAGFDPAEGPPEAAAETLEQPDLVEDCQFTQEADTATSEDALDEPVEEHTEPAAEAQVDHDPGPSVLRALSRLDHLSARQAAAIVPLVQRLRSISEGRRTRP